MHSQSQNYPTNFASSESIGPAQHHYHPVQGKHFSGGAGLGKDDLLGNASDEVLHEYPDMQTKNKFVKSVDEGTFNRMKQQAANS